jgi:hypothetical protein
MGAAMRLVLLMVLLVASACASFELVELPVREADVYPTAHERDGVAVAVEPMLDGRRAERYFGADLLRRGILPVQVIVSNHGAARVRIRPADVLLLDDRHVIDPLPATAVAEIPKAKGLFVTGATAARLDALYRELELRERVLAPDESYRGVLFFDVGVRPEPDRFGTRFFRLTNLFSEPPLRLDVVLTELDRGERLRFGPFGVDVERERGI